MNFIYWIEDQIDKITPKVEVTGWSKTKFTKETFNFLINRIISELQLTIISNSDFVYILRFSGKTFGELSQAKVFFGKEAKIDMYKNMKSRYKCFLTNDGAIEITSFEHMVGLKKERIAFKEILAMRLELLMSIIDKNEST